MRRQSRWIDVRMASLVLGVIALGVPVAAALVRIGFRSAIPYYLGINEGWNAYHALAAVGGGTLYFPADSLVMNNYPPLSFYVVGWVGSLVGDLVIGGRYVAFVAFLVLITATYLSARGLGADRLSSAFGTAATASALLLTGNLYAGMNDPQMLAHAVAMSGLAVFVSRRLGPWPAGLGGGALIAASIFVKHLIIALPIVLFLSCVIARRDRVVPLVVGALAVILVVGAWIAISFGTPFVAQILSPRIYSLAVMIKGFLYLAQPTVVMVGAGLFLALTVRSSFASLFAASYALFGYVLALLLVSGVGVSQNAGFEGMIGGGLALAVLLSRLGPGPALATVAFVVFQLCLPFAADLERRHLSPSQSLAAEWDLARETAADVDLIRAHPGPAFCEAVALCYWAGKPFILDSFNANQAFKVGRIPESRLLDQVGAKAYASIELLFDRANPSLPGPQFSPAFHQVLRQNYELARESQIGAIFVPKP